MRLWTDKRCCMINTCMWLVCQLSPRTDTLTPSYLHSVDSHIHMCCSETIFIVRVHAVRGLIYSVWIVWHCVLKKLCMCVVWANSSIYSTHTYFDSFHSFRWQQEKNDLFNQTDHTDILATQTQHITRKHVCITLIHCTLFTFFLFFWNIRGHFFLKTFPLRKQF